MSPPHPLDSISVLNTALLYCVLRSFLQVHQVDDSIFSVFAPNQSAMDEAKELFDGFLTAEREPELEFGGIYKAKIVEVRDIGVMVTLYPTMLPTLLHNSQLDQRKVWASTISSVGNFWKIAFYLT